MKEELEEIREEHEAKILKAISSCKVCQEKRNAMKIKAKIEYERKKAEEIAARAREFGVPAV